MKTPIKEGQVYRWRFDVKCRDGSTLKAGSTITVVKRTNFNPHGEMGPSGHNWLCDAMNGRTVWATLESCVDRFLCVLDIEACVVCDAKLPTQGYCSIACEIKNHEGWLLLHPADHPEWDDTKADLERLRGEHD